MKAVRVQYTVQPEYVEQNRRNIEAVMRALQETPIEGMYYSTYQIEGGTTFMHLNVAKDDETMSKLNDVEAFIRFRTQLKQSSPIAPPKAEKLNFIGASWKM